MINFIHSIPVLCLPYLSVKMAGASNQEKTCKRPASRIQKLGKGLHKPTVKILESPSKVPNRHYAVIKIPGH